MDRTMGRGERQRLQVVDKLILILGQRDIPGLSPIPTSIELAAYVGCSVRKLQLSIKEATGMPCEVFVRRFRLEQAKILLNTTPKNVTIATIANEAGFSHLGRFSVYYRDLFGHSPRFEKRSEHGSEVTSVSSEKSTSDWGKSLPGAEAAKHIIESREQFTQEGSDP
jgi:AraC-like DNA-binding protein